MSDKPDPSRRLLPSGDPDAVGYCKPPKETRFQPGKSGNPKGRPKGARNKKPTEGTLAEIVQKQANRVIKTEGGKEITMGQALVGKIFVSAVQGNGPAQKRSIELIKGAERERTETSERLLDAVMQYKNAWTAELATRAAKGLIGPTPVPHPDHLVVDFKAGTVTAIGPLTSDQALAANGGPGHERVPSAERPLTLSGSRAELMIFKNLPREEWRVPAPADPDQQVDAFKVLCDVLDDAARTKAMLARLDIPLDQEANGKKP